VNTDRITIHFGCFGKPRYQLFGLLVCLALSVSWAYDFVVFERQILTRFGQARVAVLREWQSSISEAKKSTELEKLRKLNDFINRRIEFENDMSIYNYSDYWATPLETIGYGRADCEDFAIIKYFSLRDAGIPFAKLRLVYVKARLDEPGGPRMQAHMVLAYYATPNAEPLVLDNLVSDILPASQRRDLQPIFSFNSEAIWNGVAGNSARGVAGTGQLSRWQDLLLRARKEGFE
jgi:predicted transglutaminase-like cysteine proteinase